MRFKFDLTILGNRDQLIDFLEVKENVFEEVLTFEHRTEYYLETTIKIVPLSIPPFFQHRIPKKGRRGGYRTVWEITLLKDHYKALARRLNNFFEHKLAGFPHPRSFGFIGGRNIRENAKDHCGHRHLVSLDIQNFFPSITASRVEELLESTGIKSDVANLLSKFVTIQGTLPPGLPTSPTLANAICLPLDIELQALAQKHGATYSRYADDISFSGNTELPSLTEIGGYIERHGFEIEPSKTRWSKLGQAHYVTGLSISDANHPHIPRRKKRKLRQELYYIQKYGLDDHFHHLGIYDGLRIQREVNRLDGLVKFTAHHEPSLAPNIKTTWSSLLRKNDKRPSFAPKNRDQRPFCIFIDEAEYVHPNGERMLALAMAISQHQHEINQATQSVLDNALSDMWAAGNRTAIEKRGLHFSDATEDLKLTYVEKMRSLPFQGYVAIARLSNAANYEQTYIRLLKSMIKRRLMATESHAAYFIFEQNDKVQKQAIGEVLQEAYTELQLSQNRHPQSCYMDVVAKPNLGVSVPDFLLGILGRYLAAKPEQENMPPARDRLLFERIRDKYRLIFDIDQRVQYSRRRPIEPWSDQS